MGRFNQIEEERGVSNESEACRKEFEDLYFKNISNYD